MRGKNAIRIRRQDEFAFGFGDAGLQSAFFIGHKSLGKGRAGRAKNRDSGIGNLQGNSRRFVAGIIVHHEHLEKMGRIALPQKALQTSPNAGSFVAGRNHH